MVLKSWAVATLPTHLRGSSRPVVTETPRLIIGRLGVRPGSFRWVAAVRATAVAVGPSWRVGGSWSCVGAFEKFMQSNAMGVTRIRAALVFVGLEVFSRETTFLLCRSETGLKTMDCGRQVVLPVGEGLSVGGGTIKITLVVFAEAFVGFLVLVAYDNECFEVCDLRLAALQLVLEVQDFVSFRGEIYQWTR
jgi:hypothetical protein